MTELLFNPYDIGNRYGLEMACYLLSQKRPSSVRITTPDLDVAAAAAFRLFADVGQLYVNSEAAADALRTQCQLPVSWDHSSEADCELVLFPAQLPPTPPQASQLVLLAHNALSYKSLLYPKTIQANVRALQNWLRPFYQLDEKVGLFTPGFLTRWTLSVLAGARRSDWHFRLGQQAMDTLYNRGPFWWLGYVVVLAARHQS